MMNVCVAMLATNNRIEHGNSEKKEVVAVTMPKVWKVPYGRIR
jgi:hypothetical protein